MNNFLNIRFHQFVWFFPSLFCAPHENTWKVTYHLNKWIHFRWYKFYTFCWGKSFLFNRGQSLWGCLFQKHQWNFWGLLFCQSWCVLSPPSTFTKSYSIFSKKPGTWKTSISWFQLHPWTYSPFRQNAKVTGLVQLIHSLKHHKATFLQWKSHIFLFLPFFGFLTTKFIVFHVFYFL